MHVVSLEVTIHWAMVIIVAFSLKVCQTCFQDASICVGQ